MKNKTLFTIFGVVCLFCIRLCTQTSEATSPPLPPSPPPCFCPGCRPDIHGWKDCGCHRCPEAQERALIGSPHDVPACFLLPENSHE